jgi:hypothetical protein
VYQYNRDRWHTKLPTRLLRPRLQGHVSPLHRATSTVWFFRHQVLLLDQRGFELSRAHMFATSTTPRNGMVIPGIFVMGSLSSVPATCRLAEKGSCCEEKATHAASIRMYPFPRLRGPPLLFIKARVALDELIQCWQALKASSKIPRAEFSVVCSPLQHSGTSLRRLGSTATKRFPNRA